MISKIETTVISGVGASTGIGIGTAVLCRETAPNVASYSVPEANLEAEVEKMDAAVSAAKVQLQELRAFTLQQMGEAEAAIFDAHLAFLDDPAYIDAIRSRIREEHQSAASICDSITEEMRAMLAAIPDEYLQARADDIRDVGNRLLVILSGEEPFDMARVPAGSIVVADELTPSHMARFPKGIAGIVTARGSKTGHAAIMARSLGIPAVLGLQSAMEAIQEADVLVVDGDAGHVTVRPDAATEADMREQHANQLTRQAQALREAATVAETSDGHSMQVFANIGSLSDVEAAIENGAEGVGLFRTEFLYLENTHWPTEDEQYEAYSQVLDRFGQRPVIIRTLDIGGDKELPYAKLPTEENPFLGHRAIRFCLAEPEIFKIQLRALLRASTHGELWIMIPMIATLAEIHATNALLAECREALVAEGHKVAEHIPVGIMIETPAAAMIADLLAPHVDFFSIGTNDLTQYTLAADRGNEQVANLYQPHHPAVLRFIQKVCEAGHNANIPVGVCGEFAGDVAYTELLVGLGVVELSMSGRSIPAVKQRIRQLNYVSSQSLANEVVQQPTAEAVQVAVSRRV